MSRASLAAALAVALVGARARAEEQVRPDQRPPRWGFEIRTGPYQPRIGSGDVRTYYEKFYATGGGLFKNHPLMTELEIDYYAVTSIGLLGPMLHGGIWSVAGPTRVCEGAEGPGLCSAQDIIGGTSTKGNDTTTLSLFPLGLGLVYRFDLLKRSIGIPLVPYAKGSFDYIIWRNTAGGSLSKNAGNKAEGANVGVRGTVGLALNLDWIEPSTASRARITTGLTDTYLFIEASQLWANNFGAKKRLDFSGTLYQAGLALDFE